jgi:hypothetical protein
MRHYGNAVTDTLKVILNLVVVQLIVYSLEFFQHFIALHSNRLVCEINQCLLAFLEECAQRLN